MTPTDTPQYPYDRGALLDERNTYSYTRFEGREFLCAWRSARQNCGLETTRAPQGRMWFRARPIRYWLA